MSKPILPSSFTSPNLIFERFSEKQKLKSGVAHEYSVNDRDRFSGIVLKLKREDNPIQLYPHFIHNRLFKMEISYADHLDLSILDSFEELQSLKITSCYMKSVDFSRMSSIHKLRSIEISDCPNLNHIEFGKQINPQNLTSLRISRTGVKRLDLGFLVHAGNMRELYLKQVSNMDYIENGYSRYSWWYKRRYYQDCEDEGLDRYELEVAHYPSGLKVLDLSFLDQLPNLRILDVSYNEGTTINFQRIPPPLLEYVDLSVNSIPLLELSWFITRNLRTILLERTGISSIDLRRISQSKFIREINLRQNKLEEIDLSPLSEVRALQSLNLSRNRLKKLDLSPLSGMRGLKYVILESNDLQKIDLSPLSNLPITHLFIGDNKLEDIDLSPLQTLPSLQVLRLTRNCLRMIDLSPLSSCKFLKKLQLARNRLESLSLEPLRGFNHLNELNLDRNPFREVNMDALRDIPQIDFIDITYVSEKSSIDITPILKQHHRSWINVGEEERFEIDVKEIADVNLEGSPLVDHPSVLDAIDFEENAKELLGAKTPSFAIKAVENHDDVIDLLTQRMLEERSDVSRAIQDRIRKMRKDRKSRS